MAGTGTKDDPWRLTTAPGSSHYVMYRDDDTDPPVLVCVVGSTTLRYDARAVDDLHAWTITSGLPALTAHVQIDTDALTSGRAEQILAELNACISEHFDIRHSTLQLEPATGRHDHC